MTTEAEKDQINQSQGIKTEGFNDPTGEYPRKDYFFGTSINAAARGAKVNELYIGGGELDVSIDLPDQRASEYPHNQVQETSSGHVIEIDDTPGGERILIKHKSGSGVELRADGSTVHSSKRNRVEVVGGDDTVIVEGTAKLIYNGNLDVEVTGDYNLTVGGNMAVKVKNGLDEDIYENRVTTVHGNERISVDGASSKSVVGTNTLTSLGNHNVFVKGERKDYVEGDVDFSSNGKVRQSGQTYAIAAKTTAMFTGNSISVTGNTGVVGGDLVDHLGRTYSGFAVGKSTTMYGTLVGTASSALFANKAGATPFADYATTAGAAPTGAAVPASPTVQALPFVLTPSAVDKTGSTPIVTGLLASSNYGVRNVSIDPNNLIKDNQTRARYQNLLNHEPNIHEIRHLLRSNSSGGLLADQLVKENKINVKYADAMPADEKIERSVGRQPTSRFGYDAIGNNAIENRSKRFIPAERK